MKCPVAFYTVKIVMSFRLRYRYTVTVIDRRPTIPYRYLTVTDRSLTVTIPLLTVTVTVADRYPPLLTITDRYPSLPG